MQQADGYLKIPMVGFTESLNISVSAAIILQSITSKLKRSEVEWRLTEEEIYETKLNWARNSIKSSEQIIERFLAEQQV